VLHHIAFDVLDYAFNGRERGQRGNDHLVFAPYGVFPCAGEDRWIAIACTSDAAFLALLQQLDAAGLADDERTGGLVIELLSQIEAASAKTAQSSRSTQLVTSQ